MDESTTSRLMLKARLGMTYPNVSEARTAREGITLARGLPADLILLTDNLVSLSVQEVLLQLRADPGTRFATIVVLTQSANRTDRARLLEAGADDVAPRDESDGCLYARIRGLLRARTTAEELRLRDATGAMLGLEEEALPFALAPPAGTVNLITRKSATAQEWQAALMRQSQNRYLALSMVEALRWQPATSVADVFVIEIDEVDSHRVSALISDIRSRSDTRHSEVLVVTSTRSNPSAATALDLGAGALMCDGFDPREMALRIGILLERKRTADTLRRRLEDGMRASVTDPLTGLFNRRYALPHLERIAEGAARSGRSFAVMVADIDHFKQVNDRCGHVAGDLALKTVADLLRDNIRAMDMVARIGGEEFLIAMPDTTRAEAEMAAERLRLRIADAPIHLPRAEQPLFVTISIGICLAGAVTARNCPIEKTIEAADTALYLAKNRGRNCVAFAQKQAS